MTQPQYLVSIQVISHVKGKKMEILGISFHFIFKFPFK
jgi:hypothetical protein